MVCRVLRGKRKNSAVPDELDSLMLLKISTNRLRHMQCLNPRIQVPCRPCLLTQQNDEPPLDGCITRGDGIHSHGNNGTFCHAIPGIFPCQQNTIGASASARSGFRFAGYSQKGDRQPPLLYTLAGGNT